MDNSADQHGTVSEPTTSRRSTLKLLGGASAMGLTGLAGCAGGSEERTSTFTYTTAPSDSMHFSMASHMASIVQQNSDLEVQLEAATGNQAGAALLTGQTDFAHFDTVQAQRARDGVDSWADVDKQHSQYQVLSMYAISAALVTPTSTDLEYMTDIEGLTISPGPADAAYWTPVRLALEKFIDYDDGVDKQHSPPSQLASDITSGAADAGGGPLYINGIVPSYIDQLYSQEDMRMLGWREDEIQAIEEDTLIAAQYVPNEELGALAEFTMTPETYMPSASYPMWTTEQIAEEPIYDLLDVLWENKQALADGHAAMELWLDDDFWMGLFTPELPVHPGAAEFYQEKGVWDDAFEVGEV